MQFRSVSRTWAVRILALACFVGVFAPAAARAEGYRNRQLEKELEQIEKQAKEQESAQYKKHGLLHDLKSLRVKGRTRVIVMLKPGSDGSQQARELNGRLARRFRFTNFAVLELPNGQLKKLARYSDVVSVHLDRDIYGDMTRETSAIGARFVQEQFDLDGAGVGVAVIDSGITHWHRDLTYQGSSSAVRVVNGQRVSGFVDFVDFFLGAAIVILLGAVRVA